MTRSPFGRIASRLLTVVLVTALTVPMALAGDPALLSGRVMTAHDMGPAAGVTVNLVDKNVAVSSSAVTDEQGRFAMTQARAGSYRLLIDTPSGAFLAPGQVVVEPGPNRPLSLTINAKQDFGFGSEEGVGLSQLGTWLIAGSVAVAALFVVLEVTDANTEGDASSF